MSKVIEIRNLSKKYLISHDQKTSYNTLRETLTNTASRWVKKLKSPWKQQSDNAFSTVEEFWALQDVSFDIEEGDRVGILGKNGAGKSTLLKLLSRITEPTSGSAKIRGRVASLLEVGTGFHPELTGKENIYLNGAILGMSSREIKQKFEQIVEFAEVERFLDTPVKRFSSGMFMRLAFAIGAHLDPDVLIVDEVLAVGDAQFQDKCLKKMQSMQLDGRTILFVSHNASTVASLCNKGLLLEGGKVKSFGPIDQCLSQYVNSYAKDSLSWEGEIENEYIKVYRMSLSVDDPSRQFFYQGEEVTLNIDYEILKDCKDLLIGFRLWNRQGQALARSHTCDDVDEFHKYYRKGKHSLSLTWNAGLFHEGEYLIKFECILHNVKELFTDQIVIKFPVFSSKKITRFEHGPGPGKEAIFLGNHWKLESLAATS